MLRGVNHFVLRSSDSGLALACGASTDPDDDEPFGATTTAMRDPGGNRVRFLCFGPKSRAFALDALAKPRVVDRVAPARAAWPARTVASA